MGHWMRMVSIGVYNVWQTVADNVPLTCKQHIFSSEFLILFYGNLCAHAFDDFARSVCYSDKPNDNEADSVYLCAASNVPADSPIRWVMCIQRSSVHQSAANYAIIIQRRRCCEFYKHAMIFAKALINHLSHVFGVVSTLLTANARARALNTHEQFKSVWLRFNDDWCLIVMIRSIGKYFISFGEH